jgi:hypothetical protein
MNHQISTEFFLSVFPLFLELLLPVSTGIINLFLLCFLFSLNFSGLSISCQFLLKMLPQNQLTRWSNRLSNFFSFKKPLKLSSNETPNVTLNHFGQILSINKERIKMNFNFWNEAIFSFFLFFLFWSSDFLQRKVFDLISVVP